MRVLIDTSCLVAAVLSPHEHHAATGAELARRRVAGQQFLVAAHGLTEAYAVLTRLPPPYRLSAADAFAVLDRNWGKVESISLTSAEAWRVVREHAGAGIGGGRIYDGHIAQCARKAKAQEILTWNVRHFDGATGIRAVAPGSGRD